MFSMDLFLFVEKKKYYRKNNSFNKQLTVVADNCVVLNVNYLNLMKEVMLDLSK